LSLQLPYAADQPAEQLRLLSVEGTATFQRASGANPQGLPARSVAIPLLLLQGDWDEAKVAATQAYGRGLKIAFWYGACDALARLAWAQGDAALVGHITHDLIPDGPATEPGNDVLWIVLLLQRLAATMALDTGDLPTARAWLEAHDRWLQWSGVVLGRADGALLWGQYHHANGDLLMARQHAEQALADATDPRQPLALIAVLRFLGLLDTNEGQFAAAEQHLQESLTLADACAAPFERALTLLEIARLRLAQGQNAAAIALLAEVRSLCEPLEAKPTLERVVALEQQMVNTERADG
jgi:tetratricopeptide (TPR) repeat protein